MTTKHTKDERDCLHLDSTAVIHQQEASIQQVRKEALLTAGEVSISAASMCQCYFYCCCETFTGKQLQVDEEQMDHPGMALIPPECH